jgi:hypothetical protein
MTGIAPMAEDAPAMGADQEQPVRASPQRVLFAQ